MLPPTTATDVQIVCPRQAPTATPTAFLCVASWKKKRKRKKVKRPCLLTGYKGEYGEDLILHPMGSHLFFLVPYSIVFLHTLVDIWGGPGIYIPEWRMRNTTLSKSHATYYHAIFQITCCRNYEFRTINLGITYPPCFPIRTTKHGLQNPLPPVH